MLTVDASYLSRVNECMLLECCQVFHVFEHIYDEFVPEGHVLCIGLLEQWTCLVTNQTVDLAYSCL